MRGNTHAGAKAQLEQWLACASPEIVGRTTVDQLAMRYRIDRKYLECRLLARQDRIRREAVTQPL